MSSENISNMEDNNYINISESQTLDSLLQNTCDTPSQCESIENINNPELKPEIVLESFRKRSHSESMNVYINTLKPKDVIIFVEDIKYFSHGTAFMTDFRAYYFDQILKYLNGGDPLKNDFGRDPHTSAYSLFTFSSLNTPVVETCRDTVRIIKIMDALDNFKSSERNLNQMKISMKGILEKAKNEFLYFDNYRNNHPKRKRYLIFIFHSDVCLDDIDNVVKDLNSMKVRLTAFGVYRHETCVKLCEVLNYNNKGGKDLSCFSRSDRWPIAICNGLYKYFENSKSNQAKNKNFKWTNSREQSEPNEFEFINLMNSTVSQMSDNVMQHMTNSMADNHMNTSLSVRSLPSNDALDSNYSQASNSFMGQNQNMMQHVNIQSKYAPTSSSNFYPNAHNQSDISKNNQIPFFSPQEQFYPTSSSVNNTSHRSTPLSLIPSQSPQFHTLSSHASMPQTPVHNDQMKPNSVDNSMEIISPMSNLSNQLSITKSNQINPEMDLNSSIHRFPSGNMPFNSNYSINPGNLNRYMSRQQFNSINQARNNQNLIFDGHLKYSDDGHTDIRIYIEQTVDLSLLIMHSWESQCNLQYMNYMETNQLMIYGKSGGDNECGNIDGSIKIPMEVFIKINQLAMENITATLSSKQTPTIAVLKPNRAIPQDVYVQCICIMLNRNPVGIKVFIPADPRSLLNDLRTRIQPTAYPVNQSNPMYNQMKRNNFVPSNQQMYNMSPNIPMQRTLLNRYNSHSGGNIPMLAVPANPNYRNIPHQASFMNSQQMSPATNYILHTNQYQPNPNQASSASYQLPMEMNMQSNPNIYDQNSY